jgi:hypothetical protein
LYNDYHDRGYEAVAIGIGEGIEAARTFARLYSFSFLSDSSLNAWNLYKMGTSSIPLNYVVDTAGLVVNSMETFNEDSVRSWIEPYLSGVEEAPAVQPIAFSVSGANPAVGHSAVRFSLPRATNVTLRVYSTSGALVRTLANGQMPAGASTVNWNLADDAGRPVGNGLYLYELNAGSQVAQAKVSILK